MQFGTCGNNYSSSGEVWIDFNSDEIFSPSESIGTWSGTPPTSLSSFSFTVPSSANSGLTRMRVIQAEGLSNPIDPCASFSWGSATDFFIYIQNGVDCSSYMGNDFSNPRPVTSLPFTEIYDNSICFTNENLVYNSPDVFYQIILTPGTESVKVSLCGSSFDTFLTVFDKNYEVLAINDDYESCGTQSEIHLSTNNMDTIYAVVEGWGNSVGEYTIAIDEGTLGVSQVEQNNIQLYPNPAIHSFYISSFYSGPIKIVDSKGRVILQKSVKNGESINIEKLEKGIYFVDINTNTRKKLIKQ